MILHCKGFFVVLTKLNIPIFQNHFMSICDFIITQVEKKGILKIIEISRETRELPTPAVILVDI